MKWEKASIFASEYNKNGAKIVHNEAKIVNENTSILPYTYQRNLLEVLPFNREKFLINTA